MQQNDFTEEELKMFEKLIPEIENPKSLLSSYIINFGITQYSIKKYCRKNSIEITDDQSEALLLLMKLYAKKEERKPFSKELKEKLYKKQNGICSICKKEMDHDLATLDVDHRIPYKLVGDSLQDNYFLVHHRCNLQKNGKIKLYRKGDQK